MHYPLRKTGLKLLLLLVCLSASVESVLATTAIIPSDDDIIVGARAIIIGKVLSVGCRLDPKSDQIFTYTTLRVQGVLKGRLTERKIVLKELGGEVEDRGTIIFGAPQFTPGEEVLLYLDTWSDGSLRVYQMFIGKFKIVEDARTGLRFVTRDVPDQSSVLTGEVSIRIHARGATTDRLELAAYTEMVRSRLAANWERAQEFEATHYRDVPMIPRPAAYSQRGFQPQFVLYPSSIPVRWFEPDSGQPVIFKVNPDRAPTPQILDDVSAALNVWSTVQDCSLRLANGGTSGECSHHAPSNMIVFNNCDGRFVPSPDCAGIIAYGSLTWDRTKTKRVNGTTFYKAINGYIAFNPYSYCSYDNRCNVQEVTTHELGHTLGLGHSQHLQATMFASAHFDGRCAALHSDDANGITYIYPVQDLGTRPLTITTISPMLEARRGIYYNQVFSATGGSMPYRWGVLLGEGRVPSGLILVSSGVISGIPAEAETANFTAFVVDGEGNSAEKTFSITVRVPYVPYDSEFISQTLPSVVQAGQSFSVKMKWLNVGTQIWDGQAGLRLASQNNTTWGTDRVPLTLHVVPVGQQLDVTFSLTAPATPGAYNFQWRLAQEGIGSFGQMSTNAVVTVPGGNPLTITNPSTLLEARKGSAFSYQPGATGGTPPYTWSITAGALPTGLSINAASGAITGTPTVGGIFNVGVTVRDQRSESASQPLEIKVVDPETIPVITEVSYKAKKRKLTVRGDRIAQEATLLIDGVQTAARFGDGALVVKRLTLTAGRHEIRIVNPNNVSSDPLILDVD